MPLQIQKRDDRVETWSVERISQAILKSLNASGIKDPLLARRLAGKVEAKLEGQTCPEQELVQDTVEQVLMESRLYHVARRYIVYREQRRQIRSQAETFLDITETIDSYLNKSDWRVSENANMAHSFQGLMLHLSGSVQARYSLEKYPEEIRQSHEHGYFHIHDLSFGLAGYCSGWSLRDLLLEGFNLEGRCSSGPAKHFDSALGQMVNFLGTLQNEWAGAQAFNNVDTYLAPLVHHDGLSYDEVKQAMQKFIFNLNTTSRWGGQSPFTNLTFDLKCPAHIAQEAIILGGKLQDSVYGDYTVEMEMINRAFLEVMLEGDYHGRIFSFPIPTYNVTPDFPWESEVGTLLLQLTAKYGAPYFQNFINSDLKPEDVRSMCPLHPATPVLIRSSKGESVRMIGDIYNTHVVHGSKYEARFNGEWFPAVPVRVKADKCFRITMDNGVSFIADGRHEQPVIRGRNSERSNMIVSDLVVGDYLPFNANHDDGCRLSDDYFAGVAAGAFLGDGSYADNYVTFSLNCEKKAKLAEELLEFFQRMGFTLTVSDDPKTKLRSLRVKGRNGALRAWFGQFIEGEYSLTKRITNYSFEKGPGFLQGLLDGWYSTDGGNRGRIYTANESLVEDFARLCGYLGHGYDVSMKDDRDNGYKADTVIHVLKFHSRTSYGDVFFKKDDMHWVRIASIEPYAYDGYVYCLAIDSDEHLFELGNGLVTHNCRLQMDLRELRKRTGGLFGAGDLTGSIGVVTLNLPKLAYLAQGEEDFLELVGEYACLAKDSLEFKRKMVSDNMDKGMFPFSRRYLKNGFKGHFSTIGLLGGHEACLNLLGKGIETEAGTRLMVRVLDYLRELTATFQEKTGNLYNLEATPAEGTCYRLAKIDKKLYADIQTSGNGIPYYTNSTLLPVGHTTDAFTALEHQNKLQPLYTGGTVFHSFLGEAAPDIKSLQTFIVRALSATKIPYISITPTFSVCKEHGYLRGEEPSCPHCNQETEVYTRVVGYYRPVKMWNKGKQQEYKDRITYSQSSCFAQE